MMLLAFLTGCVINGDKYPRPSELVPSWMVDRTRLLAIQANPPEVEPGAVVAFSALIGRPPGDDTELGVVWLACPVDDSGNGFGCVTDLTGLDDSLATLDPQALAELGLIGFEPGFAPVYAVPNDLLDELPAEERAEGAYVLIQVSALPLDVVLTPDAEVDLADIESGYKRLVVSEATTPNHNPDVAHFTLDGTVLPFGAVAYVEPNQVYQPGLQLADGAVELYEFVPTEGPVETRLEEPYAAWYTTGGQLIESVTLFPYFEASWVSPAEVGTEGTWYAVVRDRRGGQAWIQQRWAVGP